MVKEQTTTTTDTKEAAEQAADVKVSKRKYFLPQTEQVVEADSAHAAAKQAKKDKE